MFKRFIQKILTPKSDQISVSIALSDNLLMVHLCVNNSQKARIQCVIQPENKILIGDIIHIGSAYNKGYGSMMMEKLIAYAKENHYCSIHGNLSVVDLDHKDRLHHFYRKFGFVITEYPHVQDNYYGEIEMLL